MQDRAAGPLPAPFSVAAEKEGWRSRLTEDERMDREHRFHQGRHQFTKIPLADETVDPIQVLMALLIANLEKV